MPYKNKAKQLAYVKAWNKDNPILMRGWKAQWEDAHRAERNKDKRDWDRSNKAKRREAQRRWRHAHRQSQAQQAGSMPK